MKKFKFAPVKKKDGDEEYIFVGGRAEIPGMLFKGKPMTVTLKEFNELRSK